MRFAIYGAWLLSTSMVLVAGAKRDKRCPAKYTPATANSTNNNVNVGAVQNSENNGNTGNATTISTTSTSPRSSPASTATASATASAGQNYTSGGQAANNDASVSTASVGGKVYSVQDQYSGSSFFDGFNFDTFADPTHGNVNYLSESAAMGNLAYVQNGVAVIKVDNTNTVPAGGNRNSVRISSKNTYSSGLIVLDVQSMPYGCGVWPAFWTVGPNWPHDGEIDIVEGVNNNNNNQMTLHTSSGCSLDTSYEKATSKRRRSAMKERYHPKRSNANSALAFSGNVATTTCDASADSNTGCAILDPSGSSYGAGLNAAGGGVFATLVDDTGIAIWFFPRSSIPSDLSSKKPKPSGWGSPKAFWASSSCPTSTFFKSQQIVINTTLCGDWAGSAYSQDGCPGTCAQRVANPQNFDTAQWKIRSVTVYH